MGIRIALHTQLLSHGWRAPNPPAGQEITEHTLHTALRSAAQTDDGQTLQPCNRLCRYHCKWGSSSIDQGCHIIHRQRTGTTSLPSLLQPEPWDEVIQPGVKAFSHLPP